MDIDILRQAFPITEHPGLETTDPRLTDAAALAQDGDYPGAAAAAQEVFAEGVVDIRLMGFFLYGLFQEGGVRCLGEVFTVTAEFLSENSDAIGPVEKREKHAQTAFRWLFNQMSRKLDFEEKSQGTSWRQWVEETTDTEVEAAIEGAEALDQALREMLDAAAGPILDGLGKVEHWLRAFLPFVTQEEDPEPEEEVDPDDEPDSEDREEEDISEAPDRPAVPSSPAPDGGLWVEGSIHLGELMRKLSAFDQLMAQEKFPQATVVADDIFKEIEQFDPLRYFPKLFSRFFMRLATHGEAVLGFEDAKETPQWRFLQEYFKVDPDGFSGLTIGSPENRDEDDEDHQEYRSRSYDDDDD